MAVAAVTAAVAAVVTVAVAAVVTVVVAVTAVAVQILEHILFNHIHLNHQRYQQKTNVTFKQYICSQTTHFVFVSSCTATNPWPSLCQTMFGNKETHFYIKACQKI